MHQFRIIKALYRGSQVRLIFFNGIDSRFKLCSYRLFGFLQMIVSNGISVKFEFSVMNSLHNSYFTIAGILLSCSRGLIISSYTINTRNSDVLSWDSFKGVLGNNFRVAGFRGGIPLD